MTSTAYNKYHRRRIKISYYSKEIKMKKIFAILALALSGTAFAADYVSVDVDAVKGVNGAKDSTAQYVRAGKGFGAYQLGLQARTATVDGGGMLNSLETTVANSKINVAGITPFIGVGYDNGFNGAKGADYTYGLIGATVGRPVGSGFALAGVKTRVGTTAAVETKQTVAFATYSIPVAKGVALNLNASKSYQDITENAYGLGLGFSF
jgi:hypothetical protein